MDKFNKVKNEEIKQNNNSNNKRLNWENEEVVLLIALYFYLKKYPKEQAKGVFWLSYALKKRAYILKISHNENFRNDNGILMMLANVQHIETNGSSGLSNDSNLKKEIFALYSKYNNIFVSHYNEIIKRYNLIDFITTNKTSNNQANPQVISVINTQSKQIKTQNKQIKTQNKQLKTQNKQLKTQSKQLDDEINVPVLSKIVRDVLKTNSPATFDVIFKAVNRDVHKETIKNILKCAEWSKRIGQDIYSFVPDYQNEKLSNEVSTNKNYKVPFIEDVEIINKPAICFNESVKDAQIVKDTQIANDKIIESKDTNNKPFYNEIYTINFKDDKSYVYTKPTLLSYDNDDIIVKSWSDVLIQLCEKLLNNYPNRFISLLSHPLSLNMQREYFKTFNNNLIAGKRLSNGIWVETNFSGSEIVKICGLLLKRFNLNDDRIKIRYEKKILSNKQNVKNRETTADDIHNIPNNIDKKRNTIQSKSVSIQSSMTKTKLPNEENVKQTFIRSIHPSINQIVEPDATSDIEQLLKTESSGLTLEQITSKLPRYNNKKLLKITNWLYSNNIINVLDKYYHKDNISDYQEMSEAILDTINKLFIDNNGHTTAKMLFESVKVKLDDFFFYNNGLFNSQVEVYDLAKHLLEKEKYKGNSFVFFDKMHIWKNEPNYSKSYGGLFVKWARENGGLITRNELIDKLELIGAANPQCSFSTVMAGPGLKSFWQYEENKFVLVESININENFLEILKIEITQLIKDDDFISLNDIVDFWYTNLPPLPHGILWSSFLLKEVLRDYDVGFITIPAGNEIGLKADAALIRKNSNINTFADIVWNIVNESIGTPVDISAEELRKTMQNRGYIKGMGKMNNMHKTVLHDLRFLWLNDNKRVIISKK